MDRAASIIAQFKSLTDENAKVAQLLRREFQTYIKEPIVDIGAGTGDIDLKGWPDYDATLIDIADYRTFAIALKHRRIHADFFTREWSAGEHFRTALMSHVLQYVDDDEDLMRRRLREISPEFLITVTNVNLVEPMQTILEFARTEIGDINAEADEYTFGPEYVLEKEVGFSSRLAAENVDQLAEGFFAVVLDRALNPDELLVASRGLEQMLGGKPEVGIDQTIKAYRHV